MQMMEQLMMALSKMRLEKADNQKAQERAKLGSSHTVVASMATI